MKAPAVVLSRFLVWSALVVGLAPPDAIHAVQVAPRAATQVQRVRVPRLVDRPLETGKQMLGRSGLVVGREIPVRSAATPGTILRQSIPPDSLVPPRTAVDLYYAVPGTFDAPEARPRVDSSRVPDLTGHSRTTAVIALGIAKLALGPVDSLPDDAHAGRVVRQDPPPGAQVPRESRVAIWLGYAPLITVPDLRESAIDRARDLLERLGLRLGRVDSTRTPSGTGLIVTQRPPAGAPVTRGTAVRVAVEVAPSLRVPDLMGRTGEEAVRMIEGAELRVGVVDSVPATSNLGRVVAQDPPPDSPVWPLTRVGFRIAVQGRWVTVPHLTESTPGAAERLLADSGLRLGRIDSVRRPGGNGLITNQAPFPGARAERGSEVRVWIQVPDTVTIAEPGPPDTPSVPPPRSIIVPSVVDSTPDAARRTLEAAGFRRIRIDSAERAGGSGLVSFQLPPAGTELTAPVEVVLQVAVAVPASQTGQDGGPSRLWMVLVGVPAIGATALLMLKTRDWRKRRQQKRQPEVRFGAHSEVPWQPAESPDAPIEGPELRLVPGALKAEVEFQGEP